MKILDTFKHNGKVYEIRCWHDDLNHEWVTRAFCEGRAVEGFVYSCADETLEDLGVEAFNEMIIRSIKSDVVEDRWGQVVKCAGEKIR